MKSFKICNHSLNTLDVIRTDELFAIGSSDNKIYVFNLKYGSKMQTIPAHNDSVTAVIFMKKSSILLSASLDCSVKQLVCDESQVREDTEEIFYDHDNQITCMAISNTQDALIIGDLDGNLPSPPIQL